MLNKLSDNISTLPEVESLTVSSPAIQLLQNFRQHFIVRTEEYFLADLYNGTADQAGFCEHEPDQITISKFVLIQLQRLETGRAEAEHIGGRYPLQQFLYFCARERRLEKIAIVDCHLFLQKKLFRFPAGVSLNPTEKVNCHYRRSFLKNIHAYFGAY
jgi:hypothetical protein